MTEPIPLTGGRITPGVVRIGDTVRRPTNPNSDFVHELLRYLESVGFDAAPRFLGIDDDGREILSYREGDVPDNIRPDYADEVLAEAARLIRRYHDAVAGCELAGGTEIVCHNDISPVNFVFEGGLPVAMIDFDAAVPGSRLRDLAYGLFLWLDLGDDGLPLDEQPRRTRVFFNAYGLSEPPRGLVDQMLERQRETAQRCLVRGTPDAARWWWGQADWLEENRRSYEEALY
jgi:aminoglycoside phosphotransferase (APT) family kinase protein